MSSYGLVYKLTMWYVKLYRFKNSSNYFVHGEIFLKKIAFFLDKFLFAKKNNPCYYSSLTDAHSLILSVIDASSLKWHKFDLL